MFSAFVCILLLQGDQLNMAVFLWYLLERELSSVRYCMYTRTLYKSLSTSYQKNTAMFNWSPCIILWTWLNVLLYYMHISIMIVWWHYFFNNIYESTSLYNCLCMYPKVYDEWLLVLLNILLYIFIIASHEIKHFTYSVMQSDRNSSCGGVVLDIR